MSARPPENPIEDQFISLLDCGIPVCQREVEMQAIRLQMHLREQSRLKFLRRRAKLAEARA